jgi:hypothetical protein
VFRRKTYKKNICSGENLRKAAKLLPVVMTFGYFSIYLYTLFYVPEGVLRIGEQQSQELIGHTPIL